jgi:hypothetical protein
MCRARSRIGENRYRLLCNNRRHFCEWCLQDEQRSYQVERLLNLLRRLARVCGAFRKLRVPTILMRHCALPPGSMLLAHLLTPPRKAIRASLAAARRVCRASFVSRLAITAAGGAS